MDAPTLTRWLADVTRSLLASPATPDGLLDHWRACGLADVIERAEKVVRRERLMVDALRKGEPITDVLGRDYEDMLRSLD